MRADKQLLNSLASLCALRVGEERGEKLIADMNEMIGFANRLSELDTGGVDATAQILPLVNVLREDEARPSLDREEILKNAPERDLDGFKVPPVIG